MISFILPGTLALIGYLSLGFAFGAAYFAAMWWSAQLFAAGRRLPLAIALVAGRFALILALLVLVATRGGTLPLIAAAIGIIIARVVALRRVRAMAP